MLALVQPASAQMTCPEGGPSTGLRNMGFETGDFECWTQGTVVDGVAVTGADAFASPWEGSYMARLGVDRPSSGESQPPGPNEIYQDFVVDQPVEQFVYNVFTYDYTGYDDFRYQVTVTDPASGEVLASHQEGAWGSGTDLKSSGWRGVTLDLSGHLGETVRLQFSAGGTSDSLYSYWVYVDSGDQSMPVPVVPSAAAQSTTGSVTVDPQTGQVTIAMPNGDQSEITVSAMAVCENGAEPYDVYLIHSGGTTSPMTPVAGTESVYEAVLPVGSFGSGPVAVQFTCPPTDPGGNPTTNSSVVGEIVLYDPSGILTDAETGEFVIGAQVQLFKVPGWEPKTGPDDDRPNTCESHDSKAPEDPWSQPAPTDLGVEANPYGGEISPQVNPFISSSVGYYGWDVALGCWYVEVTHPGYLTKVSPVVGVPPEVTDLDLQLTPKAIADVATDHWSYPFVRALLRSGLTGGCSVSDTTVSFCPDDAVTRAEMSVFLLRGIGAGNPGTLPVHRNLFVDVPNGEWYSRYVEHLADYGITGGCGAVGEQRWFCPNHNVIRGDMAILLLRTMGEAGPAQLQPYRGIFEDVAEPGVDYYSLYAENLYDPHGIVGGCSVSGEQRWFCPTSPVSRAEMAVMLSRAFDLLPPEPAP